MGAGWGRERGRGRGGDKAEMGRLAANFPPAAESIASVTYQPLLNPLLVVVRDGAAQVLGQLVRRYECMQLGQGAADDHLRGEGEGRWYRRATTYE